MFHVTKKSNHFSRTMRCKAVVCVVGGMLCLMLLDGCADSGSAVVIQREEITSSEGMVLLAELETVSPEADIVAQGHGKESEETHTSEETTPDWIYVHVCGQVLTPGVYALPEGSRVWDAVEAAGGLTETAQPDAVNLARMVLDGSKVTIPDPSQVQDQGFSWYEAGDGSLGSGGNDQGMTLAENTSGLVDLNRATVEELMTIPGIGQSRAQAIVAYRQSHGSFGSIQEIMQVTGIKEGLFEAIRQYITVGG